MLAKLASKDREAYIKEMIEDDDRFTVDNDSRINVLMVDDTDRTIDGARSLFDYALIKPSQLGRLLVWCVAQPAALQAQPTDPPPDDSCSTKNMRGPHFPLSRKSLSSLC